MDRERLTRLLEEPGRVAREDLGDLRTHLRLGARLVHALDQTEPSAEQAREDVERRRVVARAAAIDARHQGAAQRAMADDEVLDQPALADARWPHERDDARLLALLDGLEGLIESRHLDLSADQRRAHPPEE